MEYRVELEVYNGPLDLLLYLIKRDELDIYDIPIARITDTYMHYVDMLKQMTADGLDINVAGDFLVMAATLMEIKSAMLLPKRADHRRPTARPPPRNCPIRGMNWCRSCSNTSASKTTRWRSSGSSSFTRIASRGIPAKLEGQSDEPPPVDLDEVQIWDLLTAFNALMKEVGVRKPKYHEVTYDDTPIDLHAADIEDRLKREPRLTLRALILGRKSKSEMIGVFLALLELIREKKILVQQTDALDDIEIIEAPEEHKRTYAHASLHLADDSEDAPPPAEASHEQPEPAPHPDELATHEEPS